MRLAEIIFNSKLAILRKAFYSEAMRELPPLEYEDAAKPNRLSRMAKMVIGPFIGSEQKSTNLEALDNPYDAFEESEYDEEASNE